MSQKSKFLKSAKLAIAGVVLTSGLASCNMMSGKHKCSSMESVKEEKANCSSAKMEKANCSSTKMEKANCSTKKKAQ